MPYLKSATLNRCFQKPCSPVIFLFILFLQAANAGQILNFLAIGDAGSGTQTQSNIAEAMAQYADQHKADVPLNFVLVLGDNFYKAGVTNVNDPQWEQKFEQMYDAKRLSVPFLAVLGNHDWQGNRPDVEIEYSRTHPKSRWKMDAHWFKRHYSLKKSLFEKKADADFFFIDTQMWNSKDAHVTQYPDKKLGEKQMAWLQKELKNSKATWKFVMAHHPLYSNGLHGHDADLLALRERLLPLFQKYKVDAYITGHDHDLQRIEAPDAPTLFLISGAAGKLRGKKFDDWKPFYQSTPGFLAVQLSATEMRGQFLDAKGNVLDEWQRTPLSGKLKP